MTLSRYGKVGSLRLIFASEVVGEPCLSKKTGNGAVPGIECAQGGPGTTPLYMNTHSGFTRMRQGSEQPFRDCPHILETVEPICIPMTY